VIGSTRGGLPELLRRQRTLDAADADGWATEVARLWRDSTARRELGDAALQTARELLSEGRYHDQLIALYGQAVRRA
jgi:glycosyltransferase involved in cell wall biosynthesis